MYKEIDTDSTVLPRWMAAADAQQKSKENSKLYSPEQQQQLEALFLRVCAAYDARVFRNFRQQFMVVKVDKPSKANLLARSVRELDYWAAENGIDIVRTKNNILYRIAA